MNSFSVRLRSLVVAGGILASVGAIALAHHICTPLSSTMGSNIISSVPFYTQSSSFGVAAHRVGNDELDHDAILSLHEGDSFLVRDESGTTQTVTFFAADFPDIQNADLHDVIDAINAKTTLFEAKHDNGYVVFRGMKGGNGAGIELIDGQGNPLSQLLLAGGVSFGSTSVQMGISVPGLSCGHPSEGALVGHPYFVLASETVGSSQLLGQTVPLAFDATTTAFLRYAQNPSALPGFSGTLDANEDASALLSGRFLKRFYGTQFPDKLYLAYVVLSPDLQQVEFVSNAFTVDFQ